MRVTVRSLCYSVRTRQALADDLGSVPHGFAHYSYALVCRKFLSLLDREGWTAHELSRPEIHPTPAHVRPEPSSPRPIHLIVKPCDEFRLLKGARNIAVVFWEFDRLPVHARLPLAHPRRSSIMNDFRHCLSLVDEVWVGCEFTRTVFREEGITNVFTIPAPIEVPPAEKARSAPSEIELTDCAADSLRSVGGTSRRPRPATSLFLRIEQARARGGRIIVTAFNPGDSRKNPGTLMLGFQFARRRPEDLLVIKLVVDGVENTLGRVVAELLPDRFTRSGLNFGLLDCPEILLLAGKLSETEMAELWRQADFYLCCSSAEGQNLPLLESMASGAVPISPATTAMADYIGPDNAFVLPTAPEPIQNSLADAYGLVESIWEVVSPRAAADGISSALAASPRVLAAKSRAAKRAVAKRYAPDAIWPLVRERLTAAPVISSGEGVR